MGKKVIELWREALAELPNELEFHQNLEKAQRDFLINRIDTALNDGFFAEADRLLREENIYGFSEEDGLHFDILSDEDLKARSEATIILTEAQRLYDAEKYGAMAAYLVRQINAPNFHLPVVEHYLSQHRQMAVAILIQHGDDLMNAGKAPEAVVQYSEAASVSPDDPAAQARIAANIGQVRAEMLKRIANGNDCNVERYSNLVEVQLDDARSLLESLNNLTSVLPYMESDSNDFKVRLGQATEKVNNTIQKLQDCTYQLTEWAPDSRNWRSSLRSGNLLILGATLQSLQSTLSAGHPQVQELNDRKQEFSAMRLTLLTSLMELEKLSRSDDSDDIEKALKVLGQAEILAQQSALPNDSDPFDLLRTKAKIASQLGNHESICGLENIRIHLQAASDNYALWKAWGEKLEQLEEKSNDIFKRVKDDFNPHYPSEIGVSALNEALKFTDQLQNLEQEKPTAAPVTIVAEGIRATGEKILARQRASLDALQKSRENYLASENYIDYEECLKQSIDLINTKNYSLAEPLLIRLKHYRPDDSTIVYFLSVCQNPPKKSSGLFGWLRGLG